MCKCEDIEMGSYDNQVSLIYPFSTPRFPIVGTKRVGIDRCIALEVIDLWNLGIETLGSCCGHNKVKGNIIVLPEDFNKMEKLGYENDPNYPDRENIFLTKSI